MTAADRKSPPPRTAELPTDLERLREELTRRERDAKRLQRKSDRLQRENDRLKQQVERLKRQLDEARRAGRRRAAPFAKDRPQGSGGHPGRRAGAEYGGHGCRRRPAQVDETHAARIPRECPDCGGAVAVTRETSQYQEDLPVVRPVVRRFDIEVGHCTQCRRRVQGRHQLQTSEALGAAGVQLGPGVVALVVELHTEMGVPLAKVAHLLRTTFGLQVTPGPTSSRGTGLLARPRGQRPEMELAIADLKPLLPGFEAVLDDEAVSEVMVKWAGRRLRRARRPHQLPGGARADGRGGGAGRDPDRPPLGEDPKTDPIIDARLGAGSRAGVIRSPRSAVARGRRFRRRRRGGLRPDAARLAQLQARPGLAVEHGPPRVPASRQAARHRGDERRRGRGAPRRLARAVGDGAAAPQRRPRSGLRADAASGSAT